MIDSRIVLQLTNNSDVSSEFLETISDKPKPLPNRTLLIAVLVIFLPMRGRDDHVTREVVIGNLLVIRIRSTHVEYAGRHASLKESASANALEADRDGQVV